MNKALGIVFALLIVVPVFFLWASPIGSTGEMIIQPPGPVAPIVTNNTGPQGPQGPTGPQGIQGPIGYNGTQGEQGIQGIQGIQGYNGTQGEQGIQGVQGEQGEAGPPANPYINTTVLYLPFEENASTTTYDWSIYSNDGDISGASWVDGKYRKALSFDGVDDYAKVPDSNSLDVTDAITITLWMKCAPGFILDTDFIMKPNAYFVVTRFQGLFGFNHLSGGVFALEIHSTTKVADGTWHMVTATYDKDAGTNNRKVYVDGVLENYDTKMGAIDSSTSDINIALPYYAANYFNGILDEVRIYNRALSANEILRLYSQGPFFLWGS